MANLPNRHQETLTQAIHRRRSVRSYSGAPLAPEHLDMLKGIARHAPRLTDTSVRFAFVEDRAAVDLILVGILGDCGKVKDAPALIVGIVGPGAHPAESLGFTMEYLVLEATRHNIGACWISDTFNRKSVVERVPLQAGEQALVVSPLGYPAGSGSRSLFGLPGSARKRKLLQDIVFADRWLGDSRSLLDTQVDLRRIAEAVRWAPSARNRQPWRLILMKDAAVLVSISKNSGLDNGIAMAHWAIAAHEEGFRGQWELAPSRDVWQERLQLPDHVTLVGVYPLG